MAAAVTRTPLAAAATALALVQLLKTGFSHPKHGTGRGWGPPGISGVPGAGQRGRGWERTDGDTRGARLRWHHRGAGKNQTGGGGRGAEPSVYSQSYKTSPLRRAPHRRQTQKRGNHVRKTSAGCARWRRSLGSWTAGCACRERESRGGNGRRTVCAIARSPTVTADPAKKLQKTEKEEKSS